MTKRIMLAAAAAAFAFAALPALASAEYHINLSQTFSVAGGHAELVATDVNENTAVFTCTSSSGEGELEGNPSKTGTLRLAFHDCVEQATGFQFPCTTSGSPEGTITTEQLSFHLKTVEDEGKADHGILIKGDPEHAHEGEPVFAEFECFIIQALVGGNGLLGIVTAPETGETSSSMTFFFRKNEGNPHHQTHQTVVGDETTYNLKSSVNGGPTKTASENAKGTATLDPTGTLEETKE